MKSVRNAALAAGIMLAGLGAGAPCALAQTPVDVFVQRIFAKPLTAEKTYVCFVRRYDAPHLAQHPRQKVSAMKLLLTAEKDPEDQSTRLSFRMGVKFRNRTANFESSGDCSHPEVEGAETAAPALGCGVECDGGGLELKLSRSDQAATISLERVRLWRSGRQDEDKIVELVAGADDRTFRLDRTRLVDCSSLVAEQEKLAALSRN